MLLLVNCPKPARFVTKLLRGERNGREIGAMSYIAQSVAEDPAQGTLDL